MRETISRAEVFAICRSLGADPALTRHIAIDPHAVTVTEYRLDEQGHKYTGDDGEAATQDVRIPLVADGMSEAVRMRHPDLPGREIEVRPRGAGQRAMAGWEVVGDDPPPEDTAPPERDAEPEAPAESGASSSPPPRGRRTVKKEDG